MDKQKSSSALGPFVPRNVHQNLLDYSKGKRMFSFGEGTEIEEISLVPR